MYSEIKSSIFTKISVIALLSGVLISCDMYKTEIIDDKKTGLQWVNKVSTTDMVLDDARKYCSTLTFAGKDDWRLPTIAELMTTINPDLVNIDPKNNVRPFHGPFIEEREGYLFSASPASGDSEAVYLMNLKNADVFNGKGYKAYVRCVRDTRFKLSGFTQIK